MRLWGICIASMFCVFVQSAQAEFTVVYPPDKVSVNQPTIAIVGTSDEAGSVTVSVKGGSAASDKVPVAYGGFGAVIKLKKGMNTITLKSPSGVVVTRSIAYGEAKGTTPWVVHAWQDHFGNCQACHRVDERRTNYRRMGTGTESCSTEKCHGDIGKGAEFIHGPVAGGVCISCHNPHGSPNKDSIERTGADQCFVCHQEEQKNFEELHKHTPVKDGNCTGCHDPHQSSSRFQLRAEGQKLCFNCHDQAKLTGGQFQHGPVGAGDCDACHDPHASPYAKQLMADGNDVCYTCHAEKKEEMALRHVHAPAAESCLNCHNAHSAPAKMLLAADVPGACWSCHANIETTVKTASVQHPPVKEGNCGACHSPHATNEANLLTAQTVTLCGSCHIDVEDNLVSEPRKHGPVADNDCASCHTVHGGTYPLLLVQYFPPEFYNAYSESLYDLCFMCHNADIARDAQTTTLTDFRDGSRNLHYLHVNKRKGRSCKACHAVHASDQEKHIRRSVPFGPMYEYPVEFTKSDNGGSCMVGCHKELAYSRKKKG